MIIVDKQPGYLIGRRLRVEPLVLETELGGVYQVIDDETAWPVASLPLFRTHEEAWDAAQAVSDPNRKRPPMTVVFD